MPVIDIDHFEGIIPRVEPQDLGKQQAQVAENVDLLSGALKPFQEPGFVQNLGSNNRMSIFLHNGEFLEFDEDVDFVRFQTLNDQFNRIYFTGNGNPKVRGAINNVTKETDLGLPQPTLTPTVTPQAQVTTTWTRTWEYWYEEPDGTQKDNAALVEGVDVIETIVGKVYTVPVIPPPSGSVSAQAIFVFSFTAVDQNAADIGTLIPTPSRYAANTTLNIDGAPATGSIVTAATSVMTLQYDTESGFFTVDRTYAYTFVSEFGEEGPPSEFSLVVGIDPSEDALIANMDTSVGGNTCIVSKRIYRSVTDSDGLSLLRLVAEIPIAQVSFLDNLSDANIEGDILPSFDPEVPGSRWDAPPANLAGLVSHPNGFLAGFVGNTVYISEPGEPHAWPVRYQISVEYPIIGLGVSINTICIMTEGNPFSLTGVIPTELVKDRYELRQSCLSKRGIADVNGVIMYPAPDGLVALDGVNGRLITESYYRREDWQKLSPETMVAEVHDKKYYSFSDAGSVIFDFDEKRSAFSTTTVTVQGLYSDIQTDVLYLIQGSQITSWNTGPNKLQIRWLSKEFQLARNISWVAALLIAEFYPVTYKVYSNGTLRMTKTVTDKRIFKHIPMRPELNWEFEVLGAEKMTRLIIGTSVEEIKSAVA